MENISHKNFDLYIKKNDYNGRGIVIGQAINGQMVQIYWIMGRSENSRNRIFRCDNDTGRLWTEPADDSKVIDPSLIIYNAMQEYTTNDNTKYFIVSNGSQTDTLYSECIKRKFNTDYVAGECEFFNEGVLKQEYEPDAPHFTPRISGLICMPALTSQQYPFANWSIVKKEYSSNESCRIVYRKLQSQVEHKIGYGITTYLCDGNPLPSFVGEPLVLPLECHTADMLADYYWGAMNSDNKISLAVKMINHYGESTIVIRNKYAKIQNL